jgi:staphylococcal nuclease domain-containing protein 1
VEHVSSGSRFRVLVPRENCRMTLVLAGLRVPRPGRQNEKAEEGGQEALEWTYRKAYQRDVEIEVEATDRQGGFIGYLYIHNNNIAKGLLEEGLGWSQGSIAPTEYIEAESRAKQSRKGIWLNYDETKEAEDLKVASANSADANPRKEFLDVVVTNMNVDGTFSVQVIGDSVHALDNLMKELRAFHRTPASTTPSNIRSGDLVAAKFSGDGEFYRAKIKKVDRTAQKADVVNLSKSNNANSGVY